MNKFNQLTLRGNFRRKIEAIIISMALYGTPAKLADALRTPDQQLEKVRRKLSKTLKSNHLAGPDGLASAADVCHLTKGWDAPRRFWFLLGGQCEKRGLGWGGLFGLDDEQRVAVVEAIHALRDQHWPLKSGLYLTKFGWDAAHIELGSNWPGESA